MYHIYYTEQVIYKKKIHKIYLQYNKYNLISYRIVSWPNKENFNSVITWTQTDYYELLK